jgi:hypothetical protein
MVVRRWDEGRGWSGELNEGTGSALRVSGSNKIGRNGVSFRCAVEISYIADSMVRLICIVIYRGSRLFCLYKFTGL